MCGKAAQTMLRARLIATIDIVCDSCIDTNLSKQLAEINFVSDIDNKIHLDTI